MNTATKAEPAKNNGHNERSEGPGSLYLELIVTDPDSVNEISEKALGRERDEFSLAALKVGVLSLKHAKGQVDAETVRQEGDRILSNLGSTLETYRGQITESIS